MTPTDPPGAGPGPADPVDSSAAGPGAAAAALADAPLLDARLVADRGDFHLDVALRVHAGEVVALLGPNGAGKTTALRVLAGLHPLSAGHLTLAGADLDRPDRRVWVPPERRPVGVVFQDYLLFPHLSARDNVAFGPRRRGAHRRAAHALADDWLARVGLTGYARRKPRQLSGGQAQRVAVARALAVDPVLLLLDEPLAALDARTRLDTRAELHRHLEVHPGATVLVTHDPLDALALADRLVVVEGGRVVQQGDAATVTARPRTDYVARLVGLNLHRGHGDGTVVRVGGLTLTAADRVTGDAFVAFPPAAVALHPAESGRSGEPTEPDRSGCARRPEPDRSEAARRLAPGGGGPRNTWPATVGGVRRHGDNLRVQLDGALPGAADVTPAVAARLRLVPGQRVWASVGVAETRAYPVGTGVGP